MPSFSHAEACNDDLDLFEQLGDLVQVDAGLGHDLQDLEAALEIDDEYAGDAGDGDEDVDQLVLVGACVGKQQHEGGHEQQLYGVAKAHGRGAQPQVRVEDVDAAQLVQLERRQDLIGGDVQEEQQIQQARHQQRHRSEDGKVQRVAVGHQEGLVFLIGLAVLQEVALAQLDVDGQYDEHQEGHRRLDGQEREELNGDVGEALGGIPLPYDAGQLVGHRQHGAQPQQYHRFALEELFGPVAQEEQEQRAQEQVYEHVEGDEAGAVGIDHILHEALGPARFGVQRREGAHDKVVDADVEQQGQRQHQAEVLQQLRVVAGVVVQHRGEAGQQQERQGHRGDVGQTLGHRGVVVRRRGVGLARHGDQYDRLGDHQADPADDLERPVGERTAIFYIIVGSPLVQLDAAAPGLAGRCLLVVLHMGLPPLCRM